MYKRTGNSWNWYINDERLISLIAENPQQLMKNSTLVKQDEGQTTVFCRDGFFFKWYNYPYKNLLRKIRYVCCSRAEREYRAVCLCQEYGFPVSPPAGYGACGTQSILVTGELAGYVTVGELFRKNAGNLDEQFLLKYSDFVSRCIDSGLFFPDFHCDNIMYSGEKKAFALIDMYGVRRMRGKNRRKQFRMLMAQISGIGKFLPADKFFYMLRESGICRKSNCFSIM